MSFIKRIAGFLQERSQYKNAVEQLNRMTDRELFDIGVNRADIHDIVRQDMLRKRR